MIGMDVTGIFFTKIHPRLRENIIAIGQDMNQRAVDGINLAKHIGQQLGTALAAAADHNQLCAGKIGALLESISDIFNGLCAGNKTGAVLDGEGRCRNRIGKMTFFVFLYSTAVEDIPIFDTAVFEQIFHFGRCDMQITGTLILE